MKQMKMEMKNLSCGYHGHAVIENINITIGTKEMWCVLGANGVGKTTFFKTALRLLEPINGHLLLNDIPLESWNRKELAKQIAYVPQNHVPPFAFTVKEVIAMGRNPHQQGMGKLGGEDRRAVEEAMELLGIEYLCNKDYTQISGGERQLTLIARAIAQQTPILVMDEPVSNLDFGNQARIISHISGLVEKLGRTVIMTTHFPDHGFLADANVLMLYKDKRHCAGKGKDVITEQAVKELYDIENRILYLDSCKKTICVSL